MADTPNLVLPYIMASQAQKHVTHNEALRKLDAIVQLSVLDRDLATPPGSANEGESYIIAAGATGDWAGHEGEIAAFQDGAWMFYAPNEGWLAWVRDEDKLLAWDSAAWSEVSGSGGSASVNPTALVGVNAVADSTNRLSVSAPASLFSNEGSDHQLKINKNAALDTASVIFQTGFSGRAEFGLTGDDDFHMKVSPDGTTFHEGIVIDKDTGEVTFPNTSLGSGGGDVSGPASSVDGEIALFNGASGKLIERATLSGMLKAASGVMSTASEGADYYAPAGTDVAIADGGTGASDAATARGNLGLAALAEKATIDASALVSDGVITEAKLSSSVQTKLNSSSGGGSVSGASETDLALIALRLADLEGDRANMVDGIADPFDDETDIDTAASVNESYDAGNYYYMPTSSVGADQIPTMTGSTTSGVTITGTTESGSRPGWHAGDKNNSTYWESSDGSLPDDLDIDLGSAATIVTYALRASVAPQYAPKSFTLSGSSTGAFSGEETLLDTQTSLANWSSGEERQFTISSPASFRYYRLDVTSTQSGDYVHVAEINLNATGSVSDMTLVSNAFSADAVPDTARIHLHADFSDTLNTDLIAEVSRDGGASWTVTTLALVGAVTGTMNAYEDANIDISGQPSGTSMKYQIKTANGSEPKVSGVVFQWS